MPSLGSISKSYAWEATEESQAFAYALKCLIPHVDPGATMEEKAKLLMISPSLLSHWLHGRRLPVPRALKKLYDLATEGTLRSGGTPLSCSFAEIEALLRAARKSTCRRCRGGCTCDERRGDRRNSAKWLEAGHQAADQGDRRNSPTPTGGTQREAPGQGSDLLKRLSELLPADRISLLWGMGAVLDENEIAATVNTLTDARMKQEVEIILRSAEAAGRDSVTVVMALGDFR